MINGGAGEEITTLHHLTNNQYKLTIYCLLSTCDTHQPLLTLHIQSEVGCSPPCLIVAHHLVHSTVTPGSAGDGDGADRGGYSSTTGDDLVIPGPSEVGESWESIKPKGVSEVFSLQHSSGLVWEEAVYRRG